MLFKVGDIVALADGKFPEIYGKVVYTDGPNPFRYFVNWVNGDWNIYGVQDLQKAPKKLWPLLKLKYSFKCGWRVPGSE